MLRVAAAGLGRSLLQSGTLAAACAAGARGFAGSSSRAQEVGRERAGGQCCAGNAQLRREVAVRDGQRKDQFPVRFLPTQG